MNTDNHEQSLLLIDGLNILRRVYEAIQAEDSPEKAQGAMRSALASFRRALDEHKPTYALAPFDFGGRTWRHELYDAYREKRKPMPQELREVIPQFRDTLEDRLGLKTISVEGVEADDVIATVHGCWCAHGRTGRAVVMSTDKDLAALLAQGALIRDHFTPEWRDEAWVLKKFGVRPDQLQDCLALIGDSSDDIPGVEKVGVKTAAGWLATYGTLENLLANANDIKGKLGERLRQQADIARLSKRLVEFRTDMALGLTWRMLQMP